ncbi:cobalamin-binding protein [Lujinxingia litoralis]|uniref:Cobalamin-binding protein n=1 Tax=Lujinxingia litoralis TaxID=2211119 RepID=A0A328C718_9DELT|nr:cobalamin-binding protein [Lujinxingia litoralis]RAL20324.1 cobalamin-binding protein [Lujinxingia litoralis]
MPTYCRRPAPQRIVCLTEETTELLYLLGEEDRIVGISAYTERPARAKAEKPVVSAFIGGSIKKIAALKPDLIIGFSDIQAQLAHDLIKANLPVLIFNQRSIQEILDVLLTLGALVDRRQRAEELVDTYIARLEQARQRTLAAAHRPRVYFEEWDEPRITAIEWVGELVELAGGINVFGDRSAGKLARERFVEDPEIIAAAPEIIVASWCGKPVDKGSIRQRAGYQALPAVRDDRIVELDPAIILQPGPACLSAGLDALEAIIRPVARR